MSTPETGKEEPARLWNIANILTMLRIVLVPFFLWALLQDGSRFETGRWIAVSLFAVAIATDKIDGDLARKHGLVTDFGKIADPIADKLLVGGAFVALSILGELPWWITAVVLLREVLVTALRFMVVQRMVVPASRGGKIKTVLQAVVLFMLLIPLQQWLGSWWLWVVAVAVAVMILVTVLTGLDYAVKILRELRRSGQGGSHGG